MFDELNFKLNFKLQNCAGKYFKSAQLEYYKYRKGKVLKKKQ